jgi:hypothetical protein
VADDGANGGYDARIDLRGIVRRRPLLVV